MVRIAGGSKGCHACRRRKKRCDEQRPSCGQCLSRNTSCPGYSRERKFINVSYQGKGSSSRMASGCNSKVESTTDSREIGNRLDQGAIQGLCSSGLSSHALSLQRSAVAYYCSSYFHNNVIQQGLDVFGKSSYIDWMAFTPDLDVDEPSLKSALLALGAARMGRLSQDSRLTRLSSESYSQTLRHLHRAIQNGTQGLRDETLASMMFLAIYEILEGSSSRGLGWASHTHGALSLIYSQGLNTRWSQAKHRLFDGFRLSATIYNIGTRKPIYLATPEWKSLPWKGCRKAPKQHLLDLMLEIPAFLQMIDYVHSASDLSQKSKRLSRVCDVYLNLYRRLQSWYEAYQRDYPSKLHWEQPSRFHTVHAIPSERVHSTCIYFPDFESGHIHLLYWTSHVLLFSNLGMLYPSCLPNTQEDTQPPFPPFPCGVQEMHDMAVNIARSVEYFIQPKTVALGACVISFPTAVAFGYFEYFNLPECDWFRQIFAYTRKFGIDVGDFLEAMPSETNLEFVMC